MDRHERNRRISQGLRLAHRRRVDAGLVERREPSPRCECGHVVSYHRNYGCLAVGCPCKKTARSA